MAGSRAELRKRAPLRCRGCTQVRGHVQRRARRPESSDSLSRSCRTRATAAWSWRRLFISCGRARASAASPLGQAVPRAPTDTASAVASAPRRLHDAPRRARSAEARRKLFVASRSTCFEVTPRGRVGRERNIGGPQAASRKAQRSCSCTPKIDASCVEGARAPPAALRLLAVVAVVAAPAAASSQSCASRSRRRRRRKMPAWRAGSCPARACSCAG